MRAGTWTALAVSVATLLGCGSSEPEPAPEVAPEPAVAAVPEPASPLATNDPAPAPSATPAPTTTVAPPAATDSTTGLDPSSYFVPEGGVDPDKQVPGFPWLRQVPGLSYFLPRLMPADLHRRFQTFEGSQRLLGDYAHEWVEREGGPAMRLTRLSKESILSHWLGLKEGDVVLFVNHESIAAVAEDVRAAHERLKTGTRFAVLIERADKPFVLSFYVE